MNHTLGAAFDYYIANAGLKPSTLSNARHVKRMLGEHGIADLELYKLNGAVIRKFIDSLNVQESTAFMKYRTITAVVSFYVKQFALPLRLDMINGIYKTPKRKSADSDDFEEEGGFLTFAQVRDLMNFNFEIKDHPRQSVSLAKMRDYFIVICFTGMAVSDLARFTPETNIKEDNGKIWLKYRRVKNNNLCRIPLSIPDVPAMEYINRFKWPLPFDVRTLQKYVSIIGDSFKVPLVPHTGRHTFGSIMLEVGFSMEAVSHMMGHSSIQTTERIYAKVSKDKIERELDFINQKTTTNGQSV